MGTTVEVRLPASPAPGQVTLLCARLRRQLADGDVRQVVCEAGLLGADLAAVEALARVVLAARRGGSAVQVRGASPGLRCLLELVGLDDALSGRPDASVEAVPAKPCPRTALLRTVSGAVTVLSSRGTP